VGDGQWVPCAASGCYADLSPAADTLPSRTGYAANARGESRRRGADPQPTAQGQDFATLAKRKIHRYNFRRRCLMTNVLPSTLRPEDGGCVETWLPRQLSTGCCGHRWVCDLAVGGKTISQGTRKDPTSPRLHREQSQAAHWKRDEVHLRMFRVSHGGGTGLDREAKGVCGMGY